MKIFLHLPKTAGTTLANILEHQIYFHCFLRVYPTRDIGPKEFLLKSPEILENLAKSGKNPKIIGGHVAYGVHHYFNASPQYITILRDPVERVISEFYFMKQRGMYFKDLIENEGLSLTEYINHPEIKYLNNLQTRMISGVSFNNGDEVTERIYEQAISNLKNFVCIGLTEKMPASLALMYLKLKWKRVPAYMISNVNPDKPKSSSVSADQFELIKKREEYDILLYQEAQRLFQNDLDEYSFELERIEQKIINPSSSYRLYLKALSKINRWLHH